MTARRIWTTAAAATARAFALLLILYELVNYSCHDSSKNHCNQNRTAYCVHNYPPNCLCKISDDICFLLCVCAYLNVLFKLCAFLIRSNEHIVLGVTKASTVKMTQKLIDEGYIIKEPYREITLTSEGIKAANELYTPSVILQDFLENRVGVERKNAENDSVAIVSQISDDALDKLVSFALQSTTNG